MSRKIITGTFVLIVGVIVGAQAVQRNAPLDPATAQIHVTAAQRGAGNNWIRAFIETQSLDPRVHVSLNELSGPKSKRDVPIRHISAASRNFEGRSGVLLTVWFEGRISRGTNMALTLTQPGARMFGKPEPYKGN